MLGEQSRVDTEAQEHSQEHSEEQSQQEAVEEAVDFNDREDVVYGLLIVIGVGFWVILLNNLMTD